MNVGDTLLHLFIVFGQLCFNQMLQVVQFASPGVIIASTLLTITGDGWLYHVNEHFWIVLPWLALPGLDQTPISCQNHDLVLETVRWTLVNDSVKCIAHDCDQHVEERNVRDYCRCNEKNVAERCESMIFETIYLSCAKHQLELIYHQVYEEDVENGRDDGAILAIICIELDHVHGVADVQKDDEDDEADRLYVNYRPNDQSHVKWQIIKQSEPVQYGLGTLGCEYESAEIPLPDHARYRLLRKTHNHDPDCHEAFLVIEVLKLRLILQELVGGYD